MSDKHHEDESEHDHGGHDGAHEIDKMPNIRLFNLLFGLSGLTLLACIAVIQLFNRQVDQISATRGENASFQLQAYRDEMAAHAGAWGKVRMTDDDGLPTDRGGAGPQEVVRYHMPIEEARRRVLADPELLAAQPKYRGWVDRDPAKQPKPGEAAAVPQRGMPGRPMPGRPMPGARAPGAAPGGAAAQPGVRIVPGAERPGARPDAPDGAAAPRRPVPVERKAPAKAPAEGKAPAPAKPPAPAKQPAAPAKPPAPAKQPAAPAEPPAPADGKAG